MAKLAGAKDRKTVVKRTCQGGRAKTSSMSKTLRRTYKKYRGQGK
jgi:hypothetical protein